MNRNCYRVRVSTEKKQIAYTENEMFEPPFQMPRQNRFSMIGQNPLYLSENLEIAKKESKIESSTKYTWIELKIKREFNMLNITNGDIPLFQACHKKTEDQSNNLYIEYLVPNYISDCAKHAGFEGIIYNSVHDIAYRNYVLYDAGKRDFAVLKLKGNNYEKI